MSNMPVNASRQAGIYVRRAREELGITRGELAALAGVLEWLIASLELGDAKGVRLDKLLSICGAVGLGLCMEQKALTNAAPEPAAPAAAAPEPAEPATTGPASQPSYDERLKQFVADHAFNPHADEGAWAWQQ